MGSYRTAIIFPSSFSKCPGKQKTLTLPIKNGTPSSCICRGYYFSVFKFASMIMEVNPYREHTGCKTPNVACSRARQRVG